MEATWGLLEAGVAHPQRQWLSLRGDHGGRPRGGGEFDGQLLFVLQDRQRLPVGPQHVERGEMIKWPRLDRDGNLCRLDLGVEVVGELGTQIAETVRSVR